LTGGAGGKGVWGKLGSELVEADVDMNDPNYDSDSLDNGDIELKTIIPEMSDEEIQVWDEFYACGNFNRKVKVLKEK
jgi:programmed cell death protein 4